MNGGSTSFLQQCESVWLFVPVMLLQMLLLGSRAKPAGMLFGAMGNLARHEPGEVLTGDQS